MRGKPDFGICVVGPSHVGKTAIINRIVNNSFQSNYIPTTSLLNYWLTYILKSNESQV